MSIQETDSPLFTVNEAAKYLRIGRSSVYRLINAGHLNMVRIVGRKGFITKADLDAYIAAASKGRRAS